ncbi:MAG: ImmA/IrrE family metallo-endopeptidase [Pirellulales bacterium]
MGQVFGGGDGNRRQSELTCWAIHRSGLSAEELFKKFPKIEEWETGVKQPTFRQLEDFAKATMTPLGVMFLNAPPKEELPIPDFRTKNNLPIGSFSPNLIDTIRTMQQRQAWMREWLIEQDTQPLDFISPKNELIQVKSLAQRIRQRLELDADWAESLPTWEAALQVLRKAIERIGILVFSNSVVGLNNHRPLDPEEFRGFVLIDKYAPVIFINDADTKSARIFTLAHELAHVWLGIGGVFNLEKMLPAKEAAEKYCNQVAAEFLIPSYKLVERWNEAAETSRPFHTIAAWFKVSPLVAARRAFDLRLISKPSFFRFYDEDRAEWIKQRENGRKKKDGGNFYATQNARLGRPFSGAVVRAAKEGRILYQDAFRLTGMKGETFNAYANIVIEKMRNERE